jgi:hypothetical protein
MTRLLQRTLIACCVPSSPRNRPPRSVMPQPELSPRRGRPPKPRPRLPIFAILDKFPRLDRDGKPLFICSRCRWRASTPFEVFCAECVAALNPPRKPTRGGPYPPVRGYSDRCVRCHADLGEDDDDWRCKPCLDAIEREESGVQLRLNCEPARAAAAPKPRRREAEIPTCVDCGARKKSASGIRCVRCAQAQAVNRIRSTPHRLIEMEPPEAAFERGESDRIAVEAFLREHGERGV